MSKPLHNTLARASLSALQWDYVGSAARTLSSMAITVVLARLLGPEPFGLVAIAWLFIGMGNLVADLGMGSALVQRAAISEDVVRLAFTFQLGMGISLTVMLALAAPLVGYLFNEPTIAPVVQALAPVFVLQAFGVVATSLLRRNLEFKRIQLAQVSSYLIGFLCLGIPLAAFGFAVWSLVVAQLSQSVLFSLICYMQVRHAITPLLALPKNGLVDFGGKVLLSNLVNWTITNLPNVFIGRVFDVFVLGLYNRAFAFVTNPMQSLVVTIQGVTFSAYSRKQNDLETIRKAYLASVGFMTLVILPAYGCVALVPTTIIHGLFGEAWEAAIPLMVPLALSMPFHAVMAIGGPMLWSQNRVETEFRAQLLTMAIFVIVLFVTAKISLTAIVWGVFGISLLRFALVTNASLKALGASWLSLLESLSGGVILLVSTGAVVLFSDHAISLWHSSISLRLALDVVVGAAVSIAIVLIAPRQVFSLEMCWLWDRVADHLSSSTGLVMRRLVTPTNVPIHD